MLGVTTYLSTDVAPVPLLWVLPLSCYLLTFIVAFGWYSDAMHTNVRRLLPSVLLPLVLLIVSEAPVALWMAIPIHVLGFTVLAMLCHGELAKDRPGVQHLTEFYLWLAAGGVLGGVFNTLVAPQVFTSVAEYPLAIAFAALVCVPKTQFREAVANPRTMMRPAFAAVLATVVLVGARLGGVARFPTMAFLGAPALIFWSGAKHNTARFSVGIVGLLAALAVGNAIAPAGGGQTLAADRTFFGVYRVRTDPARHFVSLVHGTTTHGRQVIGETNPEPLTYFHRQEPDWPGVRDAGRRGALGRRDRPGYRDARGLCAAWIAMDVLRDRWRSGAHRARCAVFPLSGALRRKMLSGAWRCTAHARRESRWRTTSSCSTRSARTRFPFTC